MKKMFLAAGAAALAVASGVAFASYADDRAEIENLSNRYMVAVDAGDIETVMSTWARRRRARMGARHRGGEGCHPQGLSNFGGAVPVRIPEGATSRPRQHHMIINHVIDVNGNTAKTIAYWFNFTNNTPQKDVQPMYMGHYEDDLVKGERQVALQEAPRVQRVAAQSCGVLSGPRREGPAPQSAGRVGRRARGALSAPRR